MERVTMANGRMQIENNTPHCQIFLLVWFSFQLHDLIRWNKILVFTRKFLRFSIAPSTCLYRLYHSIFFLIVRFVQFECLCFQET